MDSKTKLISNKKVLHNRKGLFTTSGSGSISDSVSGSEDYIDFYLYHSHQATASAASIAMMLANGSRTDSTHHRQRCRWSWCSVWIGVNKHTASGVACSPGVPLSCLGDTPSCLGGFPVLPRGTPCAIQEYPLAAGLTGVTPVPGDRPD